MVYPFESLLEQTDALFVALDAAGNVTSINRSACRILGIRSSQILGKNWFDSFIPVKTREEARSAFVRWMSGEQPPETMDSSILPKAGRSKPVRWRYLILKKGEKKISGMLSIGKIIRSVKSDKIVSRESAACQEIDTRRQFLQNVFDGIQDGISVLDRDLRIVRVNPWMEKKYRAHVPLEGKKCHQVYQCRQDPCPLCPSLKTIQTGEAHAEIVPFPSIESPTGWIELSAFPIKDPKGRVINVIEYVKDITEQKKLEQELETREASLIAILNAAVNVAMFMTDLGEDAKITTFSLGAERIFGYSRDEIIGRSSAILHMPENFIKYPAMFRSMEKKKAGFSGESILIRKSGVRFPALFTTYPILDSNGRMSASLSVAIDISDMKKTEEALRESEERLKMAMTAANDGLWDWDLNTNDVFFDQRYYTLSGYKPDEFPHRLEEFQKRVHPQDIDNVMSTADGHLKGELDRFVVEFRFLRKDGQWMWILGRGKIVERDESGKPLRFVGTHTDIGERKKADQALQESETKYRNLIQASNDGIYLLYNRKFEIINKKFEEMLGLTLEDVNKPDFDFIHIVKPEDRPLIEDRIKVVAGGGQVPPTYQFRALTKNGRELVLETSVSYIPYKDGIASQGIIRDITERIAAQEQIKKDLKEKEILLQEIHHRVKNNLSVITGLLNLQSMNLKSKEQAIEAFRESKNRIYTMALVHEKLYHTSDLSEISMKEYVKTLSDYLLEIYHPESEIVLDYQVEEIRIDVNRAIPCGLILNELITNALKHAFHGRDRGKLSVSFLRKGDRFEFSVQDDGVGLPPRFERSNTSSLGYQLVGILVEQLDGTITLSNQNGTKVSIDFPVRQE